MAETGATTELLVVTTNPADRRVVDTWLTDQLPGDCVASCAGYYAAMAALGAGSRVVVVEAPHDLGRDGWRLAELRAAAAQATVAVVADAVDLPALQGSLRADLAVTSAAGLPPLRELLLSEAPSSSEGQTMLRRSTR